MTDRMQPVIVRESEKRSWHTPELRKSTVRDQTQVPKRGMCDDGTQSSSIPCVS